MKRLAVLIAAPGPDESDNSGTEFDQEHWKSFLLSDVGGAWEPDEIRMLPINASEVSLRAALTEGYLVDYGFVAFSGHGCMKVNQEGCLVQYVKINNQGVEWPIMDLYPKSQRGGVVLLDSCRWIPSLVLDSEMKIANESFSAWKPSDIRQRCRNLYDQAIENCERGVITLHSCGIHEFADGEKTPGKGYMGGVYTDMLIRSAEGWAGNERRHGVCLDVNEAHKLAAVRVTENIKDQHPEIKTGRRLHCFPFAVKA